MAVGACCAPRKPSVRSARTCAIASARLGGPAVAGGATERVDGSAVGRSAPMGRCAATEIGGRSGGDSSESIGPARAEKPAAVG